MKIQTTAKTLPEHTDKAVQERHVNMANALARSAQGMSLSQKRIVALALAKTDSKPAKHLIEAGRNGWMIRLTADEYAATYEVDKNTAYEQLKDSAHSLLKKVWTLIECKGRRTTEMQGQWLSLAVYEKGTGSVHIVFHPQVAPHLLGLQGAFITYQLKQVAALRSIYAWRLFECLKSWETTGQWKVSVEDFAKIIQAPKTYTKDFGRIKQWILTPALAELRSKQNWIIECEEIRAGRKVTELEFRFRPDPQRHLTLED